MAQAAARARSVASPPPAHQLAAQAFPNPQTPRFLSPLKKLQHVTPQPDAPPKSAQLRPPAKPGPTNRSAPNSAQTNHLPNPTSPDFAPRQPDTYSNNQSPSTNHLPPIRLSEMHSQHNVL